MQKAFLLEAPEQQYLDSLNQEKEKSLSQYGALSLDMDIVKKQIDSVAERQRAFVRQSLMHRGVTQFESARINANNIEVIVPDTADEHPNLAKPQKTNGKQAPDASQAQ